jgi:hypothetical protein
MQIIWGTIKTPGTITPPSPADIAIILDKVWAHASPKLGLEHVTVIPAADGIRMALFLNQEAADPIPEIQSLLAELRYLPICGRTTDRPARP